MSGDGGYIDEDGYLFVMGRTDDVINVAGHRLSTGAMEEGGCHPRGCGRVRGVRGGRRPQGPGAVWPAWFSRPASTGPPGEIESEFVALVRERIGAVASFKEAIVVARLPKTRSGKILRSTMRSIADGKPFTMPSTIEDPVILERRCIVRRRRP